MADIHMTNAYDHNESDYSWGSAVAQEILEDATRYIVGGWVCTDENIPLYALDIPAQGTE